MGHVIHDFLVILESSLGSSTCVGLNSIATGQIHNDLATVISGISIARGVVTVVIISVSCSLIVLSASPNFLDYPPQKFESEGAANDHTE